MRSRLLAFAATFFACACLPVGAAAPANPLVVGWHDEFRRAGDWTPTSPGGADITQPRSGVLTLTLGPMAVYGPNTFAWASVSRNVDVDLDAYPILAARALRVSPDCWWDAIVQASDGSRLIGAEFKSDSLPERGLIVFDVGARFHRPRFPDGFGPRSYSGGRQRLRLRLNVAGLKRGGSVDYAWARFIRREDAARLRRQPDLQTVLLAP